MSYAPGAPEQVEAVKAKAREAVEHAEAMKRLPWWHRKRRRHARAADKAMREGFETP